MITFITAFCVTTGLGTIAALIWLPAAKKLCPDHRIWGVIFAAVLACSPVALPHTEPPTATLYQVPHLEPELDKQISEQIQEHVTGYKLKPGALPAGYKILMGKDGKYYWQDPDEFVSKFDYDSYDEAVAAAIRFYENQALKKAKSSGTFFMEVQK